VLAEVVLIAIFFLVYRFAIACRVTKMSLRMRE
jgi:hypothetical protein